MNRTRRAFDYQPPTYEEASKLTERRGSRFDGYIKDDGPRFFKPKPGDNFIRILPNTWEGSKHYALPIRIHRGIGPDNQTYLCLKENDSAPEKNCPICEERYSGKLPQKDADMLRPQTVSLVYLIDRANEDQGPMIWAMSNKSDTEILAQSIEKRQQRYLPIAHPIDGYDIEFIRDGEGINTRYRGFKVARTTSPVHDNGDKLEEWLNYIEEKPLPDILQFYPAERIKSMFHGKAPEAEADEVRPLREEVVRERVREEVVRETRPPVREEEEEEEVQPNGHDVPFDTDTTAPRAAVQRQPLSERPTPRDVEPNERRPRATLGGGSEETNIRKSTDDLRARLQARRGE